MAMISRRGVLRIAVAGVVAASQLSEPRVAIAQTAAPPSAAILRLASSSARMQAQASDIVLKGDVRPEVRRFAERMSTFRRDQVARLQAIATETGTTIPAVLEFEHQVALDNLAPLDFLALGRRYVELELQALAQEKAIWDRAAASSETWLVRLAAEMLPQLERLLSETRKAAAEISP